MTNFARPIAVAAALCLGLLAQAGFTQERLVVTAYGGVWKESVEKNFASCYTQRTGQQVAIQTGESTDWLNRIRANPSHPPIHVVAMAQADTMRAVQQGLLEKIDPARVPHLKQIPDRFHKPWNDYAVDVHIAGLGIMYNKDKIPNPPADWKTLVENIIAGKYGKRIAWPSGTYSWGPDMIWFMSHIYGGDVDKAFAKLKAMQPYVVKFWTSPVEVINLFGSKEVDIAMYWDGRAYAFIDKGNSWAAYYNPKPGSLAATVAFAKVKNSPESAWAYLDCALTPEVQLHHAETLRYAVTNPLVKYPPDLEQKISQPDELVILPYAEQIGNFPKWVERWNKEMH